MAALAACACRPGFYRTRTGDVVEVVTRSRVSGRWPLRNWPGGVPYRRKAPPRGGAALYGWLPPGYLLRPAKRPRWWRRSTRLYYPVGGLRQEAA
jgi:hypothetical protein